MHINELNLLFEKYLKRKPNNRDIEEHIKKLYSSFEKEISICNGNSKKVSHNDSLYYIYCSYPERMLQIYLNDHMLVSSKGIIANWHP